MHSHNSPQERGISALLVTLLSLILIASPLLQWWGSSESPWYTPYLLWGGMILLIATLNAQWNRHGQ